MPLISAPRRRSVRRPNVVVAGAESVTGMNAGRALVGKGFKLIGVTSELSAPASKTRVWDQLEFSPKGDGPWLDTLEEVGARLLSDGGPGDRRSALLLSSDALVIAAAGARERLSRFYRLVLPDEAALQLLMDKTLFQEWAVSKGFPVPASEIVGTIEELEHALEVTPYPLILKPLVRTPDWDAKFSNDKLFVLQSRASLYPSPELLLSLSPRLLVQQWIPGGDEEVLFCLAYARKSDGQILASYCGQKWLQWPPGTGSTAVCAGIKHPELERLSLSVLEQAGLRGLGSVEVKRSPVDGRLYLTEPTVGRNDFQSYIAVAGGVNLTWMAVCDALDLPLPQFRPTARATWADEIGMVQSARAQRAWISLVTHFIHHRPRRVSWALWSFADPRPALARAARLIRPRRRFSGNRSSGTRLEVLERRFPVSVASRLSVSIHGGTAIHDLQSEWAALHAAGGADPLFMSWAWQSAWWDTYADAYRLEGAVHVVRDSADRVVGIAPFVRRIGLQRRLPIRRLEMLGNVWRIQGPMRSEYLDMLLDPAFRDEAVRSVLGAVDEDGEWDEFVFSDLKADSPVFDALKSGIVGRSYLRVPWRQEGYSIDTDRPFDDYLRTLSGNVRRKLYLQRSKLARQGAVTVCVYPFEDFSDFMKVLDRLHQLRWGRPFFIGRMRRFHASFVARLPGTARSRMSVLAVGGTPVSALYNIEVAGREYNLQGGFDAAFCPGVSLAKLHMGYAIERACEGESRSIELLVGGGRVEEFKREFADVRCRAVTVQLLRGWRLQPAYRLIDWVRGSGRG